MRGISRIFTAVAALLLATFVVLPPPVLADTIFSDRTAFDGATLGLLQEGFNTFFPPGNSLAFSGFTVMTTKTVRHSNDGDIVNEGILTSKHILIVKSYHFLDDVKDKKGNVYYFYMVDRLNGLTALISTKELYPVEKFDEKTKKFVELVKEEIRKDGGIEAIIKKFKKSTQVSSQHI